MEKMCFNRVVNGKCELKNFQKGTRMKKYQSWVCMILCGLMLGISSSYAAGKAEKTKKSAETPAAVKDSKPWQDTFNVDKANLKSKGTNTYFILQPGYILTYKNGDDELVITVTDKTKEVDGVKARIVEERETKKGVLVEVSQNYFAIDKTTKAIYYFGEDVDNYKDGQIVNHDGAWLAGEKGATFGLAMPAEPKVGDKYYQEIAPTVAMDRAEVKSVTQKVTVPAGTFENCLVTEEGSDLEKGLEKKQYAPGVGLLADAELKLVSIVKPEPKVKQLKADQSATAKPKQEKNNKKTGTAAPAEASEN